jgi:hypothetical protein
MKTQTKKAKVIAYFQANPNALPKAVSTKFKLAMPAVYSLRKQALAIIDEPTPLPELSIQRDPVFVPSNKADDVQYGGDHYKEMGVQPWKAMESWMSHEAFMGFLRGNAIKYLARTDKKGGVEDLKKARHYLDKLIEIAS